MRKIKVLLWSVYSPWTINFVENFLLKNNYEVWIVSRGYEKEQKKYIDFYKEKGIHLIEFPPKVYEIHGRKDNSSFLEVCYGHFLALKEIIKSGTYDLINMQYVDYADLADVIILKYMMKSKLVLSYWGSDLFRIKKANLDFMSKASEHADFITFDNADLEMGFRKIRRQKNKIPLKTVLFGLPILDIIEQKQKSEKLAEIRRKWGITENKVVIAVGYNGLPEQQHKKILGVIEYLDSEYKERIILLLQMSYRGSRIYRNSVVSKAKKTGCEYIEIQRFLENEEVAELRMLTDIFINAQSTDAFSGSVCENLFAGTLLINARWLRYKELEKYHFKYLEFEDFSEINRLIKLAMEQKMDLSKNRELVWKLRSWQHCSPQWEDVYRRMCE